MSKYAIPAIATAFAAIANSAEIGAENRVFYSLGQSYAVGNIQQSEAADGVLTLESAYAAPTDLTKGYDMQAVLRAALNTPGGAFSAQVNATFAGKSITDATSASPGVIHAPGHGLTNGDHVNISGVTGSGATVLNGNDLLVTVVDVDHFSVGVNTTGVGAGGAFEVVGTATIAYAAPTHVTDQGYQLPQGIAVDIAGDGNNASRQIRSIVSLVSCTNGDAGNWLDIMALPDASTYVEIGTVDEKSPALPSPEGVRIPSGYYAAKWTKLGRESDPKLTLKTKYQGFLEGAMRLNGFRSVIKIEVWKDKRILSERMVFTDVIAKCSITKPDGNGMSMADIDAIFSSVAVFC